MNRWYTNVLLDEFFCQPLIKCSDAAPAIGMRRTDDDDFFF